MRKKKTARSQSARKVKDTKPAAPRHKDEKKIFEDNAKKGVGIPTQVRDGFDNFVSRVGLNNQNTLSAGSYFYNLITRNRILLEMAYRGSWIVGRVIDCVAQDMTRAGLDITTAKGAEKLKKLSNAISRLKIWNSLKFLIQWGRLYGGAIGVIQIEGQDTKTPLNLDSVGKGQFQGIVIYDRWQVNPAVTELINAGPDLGLPLYYDITTDPRAVEANDGGWNSDYGGQQRVHFSRCIRYTGIDLPYMQAITEMMWGESVLERLWDRLISFDNASMSAASLIDRANLRTISIDGLREIIAAGGKAYDALIQNMNMIREFQTNEGMTLLDKNDVFQSDTYTFSGLSDMLLQFAQQLSGSAEVPLMVLMSQSPAGLGDSGENDVRIYYDGINSQQNSKLRNGWHLILQVMWRSEFSEPMPDDLEFTFTPLWQMSETEKATNSKTITETIVGAYENAVTDKATTLKELKNKSGETGLFGEITEEMIADAEAEALEEPPMPGEVDPETGEPAEPPHAPVDPAKGAPVKSFGADAKSFKENEHPRKDDGKFGEGSGGSKGKKSSSEKSQVKQKTLVTRAEMKTFLKDSESKFSDIKENNPKMQEAAFEWSRAGYQYARKIQKGEKVTGEDKEIGEAIVNTFDKSFDELPSYEGPLVRDLQMDVDDALGAFKEGAEFELDAHSSFTAAESYGRRKVRLVVESSKSGKAIWGLCQEPQEAEVLIPKGQKFKITKVEESDDIPYVRVHIEEID